MFCDEEGITIVSVSRCFILFVLEVYRTTRVLAKKVEKQSPCGGLLSMVDNGDQYNNQTSNMQIRCLVTHLLKADGRNKCLRKS